MRYLKILIGLLVLLALTAFTAVKLGSSDRPTGVEGPEAEAFAAKIMAAVDCEAWAATRYVRWDHMGGRSYLWDRFANRVRIDSKNHQVYLDAGSLGGSVFYKGALAEGATRQKAMDKAVKYFFNDSFWLNAPCKMMDEGVSRSLVDWKGEKALLVTYSSGGVTPGDAYLWLLDENDRPRHWKMWTQVIPVQGLGNSWIGWETLSSGAQISTQHGLGPMKAGMIKNLAAGATLEEIGEYGDALDNAKFR